jgi:hypothetical protein
VVIKSFPPSRGRRLSRAGGPHGNRFPIFRLALLISVLAAAVCTWLFFGDRFYSGSDLIHLQRIDIMPAVIPPPNSEVGVHEPPVSPEPIIPGRGDNTEKLAVKLSQLAGETKKPRGDAEASAASGVSFFKEIKALGAPAEVKEFEGKDASDFDNVDTSEGEISELADYFEDPRLKIQAIAWSAVPGESVAVINNRVVREGNTMDGISVVRIGEDSILFQEKERRWKQIFRVN